MTGLLTTGWRQPSLGALRGSARFVKAASMPSERAGLATVALLTACLLSHAAYGQTPPLQVMGAWSRATPNGAKVAAGYLTIKNDGPEADRLTVVSSDISGRGAVHEMGVKDGVMTMRELSGGLQVPPGQSVTLKPGGFHLMFEDLKHPLKSGERFDATLVFEKAGQVKVNFEVRGIGDRTGPSMDAGPAHKTQ